MDSKTWYTSKTVWVNIIAVAAMILTSLFNISLSGETQVEIAAIILAIINLVLRFKTNTAVTK